MSEVPKIRCPKCGARVPATYLVCPYCGAELVKEPVLIAEARRLRERIKTLYLAIRTLNFTYILELILVPVPEFFTIDAILFGLLLASPYLYVGYYRYLSFAAAFFIRYLIFNILTSIYIRVIAVRKLENHDLRTEALGLGSLRLFRVLVILLLVGYTSIFGLFVITAGVYSIATAYLYFKYKKYPYVLIPLIAFAVVVAFVAL